MTAFSELIQKLDSFIKKYYRVKIMRGLLISAALIFSLYLIFSLAEHYFYFSTSVRTLLFYLFFLISGIGLTFLVILPALKLAKIGKIISYEEASEIIVSKFPSIQDKLKNILELKNTGENNELVYAAIEQKSANIKVFPIQNVLTQKQNTRYLKYVFPPLFLILILLLISPGIFRGSNNRIIHYDQNFAKPAPFQFLLQNRKLKYKKGEDAEITVKIEGKYVPEQIFISYNDNKFLMNRKKNSKTTFTYDFKNINHSFSFHFFAQDITSDDYKITVLPAPRMLKTSLHIQAPKYTQIKDTLVQSVDDVIVPYGSKLTWTYKTKDVDTIFIKEKKQTAALPVSDNIYTLRKTVFQPLNYEIYIANHHFQSEKLMQCNVSVIPDVYPSVMIEQARDSANIYLNYFKGLINDDYGFTRLRFCYKIISKANPDKKTGKIKYINLPFEQRNLKQEFYYSYDFSHLRLHENQKIEYYFEVTDNDAIRGGKTAKSAVYTFEIPDTKALKEFAENVDKNMQSKLDKADQLTKDIQKDFELFREKNLNGNTSQWENKQMLENIFDKQKLLEQLSQELSLDNKEKNKSLEQISEKNQELLEKQKEIQKMLDEILTDEMKELMKQIQNLQNNFNQNMMNKLMEKYEFSYQEMSDRLDRTKELLKKEQVKQKMDKIADDLDKLAEEQKQLSEETKNKKSDNETLKQKQKDIEKKFEDLQKEYKEALKQNEELKNKMNIQKKEEEQQKIKEEFEKTDENLSKKKNKKASESQQKNAENMEQLSKNIKNMMEAAAKEEQGEDMETIRRILNNLLRFSFKQEQLKNDFSTVRNSDPNFIKYSKDQLELKDDFKVVNDSLKALAGRTLQVSKFILDELYDIRYELRETNNDLKDRQVSQARKRQQKIMMHTNDLALFLSKTLNQMRQSMQQNGSGSGKSKNKPGQKKESFGDLKSQQESLKKQMENMLKQLKQQGKGNKNAQNRQLAKMLAQQEIFKQMLKEMNAKFSLSPEAQKMLREIEKMAEQNEKDIANRKITPETIKRQKQIETRLLEAEKAENKQKTDNKRESKEAETKSYKSPKDIFKKNNKQHSFDEQLQKENFYLNNFYKKLYDNYYNTITR